MVLQRFVSRKRRQLDQLLSWTLYQTVILNYDETVKMPNLDLDLYGDWFH